MIVYLLLNTAVLFFKLGKTVTAISTFIYIYMFFFVRALYTTNVSYITISSITLAQGCSTFVQVLSYYRALMLKSQGW